MFLDIPVATPMIRPTVTKKFESTVSHSQLVQPLYMHDYIMYLAIHCFAPG